MDSRLKGPEADPQSGRKGAQLPAPDPMAHSLDDVAGLPGVGVVSRRQSMAHLAGGIGVGPWWNLPQHDLVLGLDGNNPVPP